VFPPQERARKLSTLKSVRLLSATEQALNKESHDAQLLP